MRGVRRAYVPHRMEKLLIGQEAKEGLLRIPRQRDHLCLMSYCSQSLHIWPQQGHHLDFFLKDSLFYLT